LRDDHWSKKQDKRRWGDHLVKLVAWQRWLSSFQEIGGRTIGMNLVADPLAKSLQQISLHWVWRRTEKMAVTSQYAHAEQLSRIVAPKRASS
jgi:hypothetical protein